MLQEQQGMQFVNLSEGVGGVGISLGNIIEQSLLINKIDEL